MCGITGIISQGAPVQPEQLDRMLMSIEHRGPDGFGRWHAGNVAIGHARLSIIDISGGRQPMSNEDGTVWITFNGEIFNYVELREELAKKGHKFSTNSDTEVIVHLYEDLGERCVERLNGQFAFAIWDRKRSELFLARDRMGIRPLFYASSGGVFYFASEIKAIFAGGTVTRELDTAALDEIFTFWCTTPPRTAFKGVHELAPAHFLKVKNGVVTEKRYWDIPLSPEPEEMKFEDAVEGLRELLIDSTRLQLRADVPIGAYLSGGLDSSITTALIRQLSTSKLHTFSVAFDDKDYDESHFQKEVAGALGTEHHEVRCSYKDISSVFPQIIWHAEKPILRTAPAPLFILSRLVRDSGLKVVLTGEGADEIAGGYDIFKETKIRQFWARFPDSRIRPLLLKRLYPYLPAFQNQSSAYREAFFNGGLSDPSDIFFSHKPRWQTTSKLKGFFSKDLESGRDVAGPEEKLKQTLPDGFSGWSSMAKAQYLEASGLLPGYILSSQGDRVLMGNSVEGRYPFLDHRVVEYCSKLPMRFKLKALNEKHILKEAMKGSIPASVVKRTKQPYLAPDSRSFFSGSSVPDYVEELLSESCISEFGYFNPKAVGLLVKKCKRGGAIGFKDNMAFVGILSTQLIHSLFIKDFRPPENRQLKGLLAPGPEAATDIRGGNPCTIR